jgi:adenylate cyclase
MPSFKSIQNRLKIFKPKAIHSKIFNPKSLLEPISPEPIDLESLDPGSIAPKSSNFTRLRTLLAGTTVLCVGFTAAAVYIPWAWISTQNIDNLTIEINQSIVKNSVLEVNEIFKGATSAHVFLGKASDRNILTFDRQDSVEQVFWGLIESRPNLTWVMFGYPNGDFFGIQRVTEKSFQVHQRKWNAVDKKSLHTTTTYERVGKDLRLIKQETESDLPPYYTPDRPWYKEALKNPGESAWTTYVRRTNNQSSLDSAMTLTKNGTTLGVLNLGFDLDQISRSLQKLQQDKKSVLLVTNGQSQLIASSDIQETIPKQIPGQNETQLNLLDNASSPLIRGIAKEIKSQNITNLNSQGFQNLRYRDPQSGEMYYVTFTSLNQLDWVIGILTPESLYLGEIKKNELILRTLIIVLIIVTLGVAMYLSDRVIVRPIMKLNKAAKQVAEKKFSRESLQGLLERRDEIGELANMLNEMAQQVDGREEGLRNQLNQLQRETELNQLEQSQATTTATDSKNSPYLLLQRSQSLRRELQDNISNSL